MLKNNKSSGYKYRERRQPDWEENYLLYRDKVKINRLTQRQSVNLPLMKQTIRTLLKDLDDMPVIQFENRDNNKDAEIFQNEYWQYTLDVNNAELKDIVDKRQELLFGRSFDQWQVVDGKILFTIEDPEDILVDRYTDPTNLDTARFLIHTHIFKPLSIVANNPDYDQDAISRLKAFYATREGLIKASDNLNSLEEKNRKLQELGISDANDPILGETYVELSLHFVYRENEKTKDGEYKPEQLWLYVECDDMEILQKKPLEEVIGKTKDNYWRNHLPYCSWADDVERQDFWSDSVGDIIRVPNKVLNVWFSQLVENRTLRSFGMNYFDSTVEGFTPPSIEPEPWGWVGVPGKPSDVFQKVDIPDLSESLDEMNFLVAMNDRATGASATQQGVENVRQVTLGEVKLALNEAKARTQGIAKFYTLAWKKRAEKFLMLIEASSDKLDAVKLYKKGRSTSDIYARDVSPKDWMTEAGYGVKIWSKEDKKNQDTQQLEKINAVSQMIPGNAKLQEILQRKALEFADLNPEEVNDIIRLENEKRDMMMQGGMGMMNQVPPTIAPPAPAVTPGNALQPLS